MTASCVAVPVSLAPMDGREQLLRSQIDTCVEGPELAGLLTELAGLHIAAVSSQHSFLSCQVIAMGAQLELRPPHDLGCRIM